MREILLVGNPNVGKSTLFNALTKSSVHTGNFHGVTVDSYSERVKINGEDVIITDLPGIYSLSGSNNEEKLSREKITNSRADIVVIADASSLRRCMYLCMQLDELNKEYVLLINTKGKRINFNIDQLRSNLNHDVYLIDAKKEKLDTKYTHHKHNKKSVDYLTKYMQPLQNNNYKLDDIILALNGVENDIFMANQDYILSIYEALVVNRYSKIDDILNQVIGQESNIAGDSRLDRILTNSIFMPITFFSVFILSVYVMFFVIGPVVSAGLSWVLNRLVFGPILDFIAIKFDNIWLVDFLDQAVFASVGTIIGFLPQVVLLFIFLTILEDSGIITRLSYVLDEFLSRFGLNGKAVYTLLLGFGCNTMSSVASSNLNEHNMRSKCLTISPYISCMARLPLFILITSCFFNRFAFLIIAGLYLLGLIIAIVVSKILDKTILPSTSRDVILEFPPLAMSNIQSIYKSAVKNITEFLYRVFTVVLSVGVVVYILTHIGTNFHFTTDITDSLLYFVSDKLKFLLAPIGLDNAGIVTCLVVGVLAKELIISTMAIINQTGAVGLTQSITNRASLIHFSPASAVSMLVFSLLYSSCASNYSIMRRNKGIVLLSILSELVIAYMVAFLFYQSLTLGFIWAVILFGVISLIVFALTFFLFKVLRRDKCDTCLRCRR